VLVMTFFRPRIREEDYEFVHRLLVQVFPHELASVSFEYQDIPEFPLLDFRMEFTRPPRKDFRTDEIFILMPHCILNQEMSVSGSDFNNQRICISEKIVKIITHLLLTIGGNYLTQNEDGVHLKRRSLKNLLHLPHAIKLSRNQTHVQFLFLVFSQIRKWSGYFSRLWYTIFTYS